MTSAHKRGGGRFGRGHADVTTLHVKTPIRSVTSVEGVYFTYQIPKNSFSDPNAKISIETNAVVNSTVNTSSFPAWLKYNPATHVISGTPDVLGTFRKIDVLVRAQSPGGQTAIQTFTLVTEPPITATSTLQAQTAVVNTFFLYHFPADSFGLTAGNTHPWQLARVTAANSTGNVLPWIPWLVYVDANTTLMGPVPYANSTYNANVLGVYNIRVSGISRQQGEYPESGQVRSQYFTLTVNTA